MLAPRRCKQRVQAGDTIIEVLVVLAILGFAFSIAYATATRALTASRQAQEHSEALQYISTQVELLRSSPAPGIYTAASSFCLLNDGTVKSFGRTVPLGVATDDLNDYPTECTKGQDIEGGGLGLYRVSATYTSSGPQSFFTFFVRWTGPGNTGLQQETIQYKLHN